MIRNRLAQYEEKTAPLIDYYELARSAEDGRRCQDAEEVTEEIRALLATLRMEEEA